MKRSAKVLDFGFNIENPHYNSAQLSIICSLALVLGLLTSSIIAFFVDQSLFAFFEITIAAVSFICIGIYLKYKNVKVLTFSTTILFLVAILSYYIYAEKSMFSIAWLFFFPLVAFLLNGLKVGTILTGIYIVTIFIYSYIGHKGAISSTDTLQVLFGLLIFSGLVYLFEYSRKEAFSKMMDAIHQLEKLSYVDELTQLYNRHFLNIHILNNEELNDKSVLFYIADIDNFKAYNDTYGHQKGDEALVQIADATKKAIGDDNTHFVIRLGGEEFGGFIFDEENPQQRIEEFFKVVESLSIEHINNEYSTTCTISAGAVYCENWDAKNFSKIYKITDEALYEAKKNGKNQVIYKNMINEE
ncbi:GGDEF domain-containing protein [Sulfurimonas autotrophica]|uniref:diguanylate cyclase n=1 Tax=Sulfurimonas autotrophica (strain ATCC BAA-671 / DSM 16294 / JCM 11897 / OK10) TaxID=563040 RepID=E0UPV1_SULAO|nr:GGDEF domain-containing protein [Sulfurimonas autotrophica]ADN09760.1 diguanylate cyclase [Sulfurimonas autotrophica DSM 16294]